VDYHRRTIRLPGFEYSQSATYFVTICTHNRECIFGSIENVEEGVCNTPLRLNECGKIARQFWLDTPNIRQNVTLGSWVIMPNHIHGIIHINGRGVLHTPIHNEKTLSSPSQTIGAIVRGYKSGVTGAINALPDVPTHIVWQRNYWEHIIRDDADYRRIEKYIDNNVDNWQNDKLHL
jgi:REP element-mobilizing transposase RayT